MRDRLPGDVAWILCGLVLGYMLMVSGPYRGGNDAHAYWLAWQGQVYTTGPMTGGAYLYSPAFAHAIWPLAQLPWPAFATVFIVGNGIALAWLLWPLPLRWRGLLWLAALPEITTGNINIPLAVTAVAGFTVPAAWAFAALTKVSVAVGPVWFLARREWSKLARFLSSTGAVVLVSAVLAPDLWNSWLQVLFSNLDESIRPLGAPLWPPLVIRFPIGIAIVVWGALTSRRWCVPVGMVFCSPVLWWGTFTLLAAIPRLQAEPQKPSSARPAVATAPGP